VNRLITVFAAGIVAFTHGYCAEIQQPVLDRQKLLESQTFWDNRDWDWYKENIPFFECPDSEINTTYYYRWELVTKHMTYGTPTSGYSFTEFIDRPFWSGAYGAISCPAGHQLYELRWLRSSEYSQDYAKYWFKTPGAQPRNYSTWLADAVWALHEVHKDPEFTRELLPDLINNFEGWEKKQWVPEVGLFWQIGHDDGMEYNINSRQTEDIVRGAPGYRPSFNAYMWADATAIAKIAAMVGDKQAESRFHRTADLIKENLQKLLWEPKREFFLQRYKNNERDSENNQIKAMSFTYETGKFAGNEHGREEIGFVPWQFNLPDAGYERAWKFLMDPDYFSAAYGPLTVERNDPMYYLSKTCCWWSGMSWPYATTQTLKAMANLLQNYQQEFVTPADYLKLLRTYSVTQRKNGKPYIAEAAHPDTGSWEGHDSYNHSEHYFHSGYIDLILTGLIGIQPAAGDELTIHPLAPESWDYFAADGVPYHGHELTVIWDRTGNRYGKGAGFQILADGEKISSTPSLEKIIIKFPPATLPKKEGRMNFAVNNEGTHFPAIESSFSNSNTRFTLSRLIDGNYWYHLSPPNRWTFEGSTNQRDWCSIDFGTDRLIDEVKLYLLDDGTGVVAPDEVVIQNWTGNSWTPTKVTSHSPLKPEGHRANSFKLSPIKTRKVRVEFKHHSGGATGLSEIEAWGPADPMYVPPPAPPGDLALNGHVTASFTSAYDKLEEVNDGRIFYSASPHNRWTTFGSKNENDWLQLDFRKEQRIGRVCLHFYADGGGVVAPASYHIEKWSSNNWEEIPGAKKIPASPVAGINNQVTFEPVTTSKIRITFVPRGKQPDKGKVGLSEIEVWEQ
jgi:hypothetical protein